MRCENLAAYRSWNGIYKGHSTPDYMILKVLRSLRGDWGWFMAYYNKAEYVAVRFKEHENYIAYSLEA